MLGQVAFDQVVRKLDLLERDYFGLLYEDDHKAMVNQRLCISRLCEELLGERPDQLCTAHSFPSLTLASVPIPTSIAMTTNH